MKKTTLIYFITYAVVLIVNVLVVCIKINNASITSFSLPAIFLMFVMIIHAVLSYFLRHKGNALLFRRGGVFNIFFHDKDYTFDNAYLSRFFLMLKVHCIAIPFYIPQIFFTSSAIATLWALVPCSFPQIVYIIIGISDTLKEVKEDKAKKEQLERDRINQERREELGKWR